MPTKPPRDEGRLRLQRMLGERVRRVREEKGWTQREAANAMGYTSPSTISSIERGVNGVDSLDLWEYSLATGYPIQFFVDPNYRDKAPAWPRTRLEWVYLAGGDERRGDAHWSIERVLSNK